MRALAFSLLLTLSCGGVAVQSLEIPASFRGYRGLTSKNGDHPGPKGVVRVLLLVEGHAALPLLCYDPLWVKLRGPDACADLIPPGAQVAGQTVIDRGPLKCGARRGVRLKLEGEATTPRQLTLWSEGAPTSPDLDGDGQPEVVRLSGSKAQGPAPLNEWPCLSLER